MPAELVEIAWPCLQVQAIFKIASSNDLPSIPEHLTPEASEFVLLCLQVRPGCTLQMHTGHCLRLSEEIILISHACIWCTMHTADAPLNFTLTNILP